MINIVRANFYRLAHTRFSWVIPLTLVVYAAVAPFLFREQCLECQTFRQLLGQVALAEMTCMLVPLWLASFFGEDFAQATVRNLMVGPRSRTAYAGAALATTLLYAAVLVLLAVAALALGSAAAGCLPVSFDAAELLCWMGLEVLLTAGFVMLALLVAMPWMSGAVTAAILAAAVLATGTAYWFFAAWAQGLPPAMARFVADCLQPFMLTALRTGLSQGAPMEGWWFADAIAVAGLTTAVIAVILRRKELR